jgi:hypothetical protein
LISRATPRIDLSTRPPRRKAWRMLERRRRRSRSLAALAGQTLRHHGTCER